MSDAEEDLERRNSEINATERLLLSEKHRDRIPSDLSNHTNSFKGGDPQRRPTNDDLEISVGSVNRSPNKSLESRKRR